MEAPSNMATNKGEPNWRDVKAALVDFDRAGPLALAHDMYAASKDNLVFLHARLGLDADALEPYRVVIQRWLCPDAYTNQDYSVARARKPIADYRKAIGLPAGLAELMVFYCEQATGFSGEFGLDVEAYYGGLLRMFGGADDRCDFARAAARDLSRAARCRPRDGAERGLVRGRGVRRVVATRRPRDRRIMSVRSAPDPRDLDVICHV